MRLRPTRLRTAISGLVLVVGCAFVLGAPAAPAGEKPLRALVWEHLDPHAKAVGAADALNAAGFDVDELSTRGSAASARADVIVFGAPSQPRSSTRRSTR